MSETSSQIAVFMIILGVLTPIFTYAFIDLDLDQTGIGETTTTLDPGDLVAVGLTLEKDQRYLLTYDNYVEFNLSQDFRMRWDRDILGRTMFQFFTQGLPIDWVFKVYYPVFVNNELYNNPAVGTTNYKKVTNQTIINNFGIDSNRNGAPLNWTRISIRDLGYEVFITCEKYDNNITAAIESGELNATLGEVVTTEEYNPDNFIKFYWGLINGRDTYGLPDSLAWVFRLQVLLTIYAGVVLVRDLLPLI